MRTFRPIDARSRRDPDEWVAARGGRRDSPTSELAAVRHSRRTSAFAGSSNFEASSASLLMR